MLDDITDPPRPEWRDAVARLYRCDEGPLVERLITEARFVSDAKARIDGLARDLVTAVRSGRRNPGGIDAFMHEYDLSSHEGIVLMCLAEALLRVPDADTADSLIRDKLSTSQWDKHLGHSDSLFVNASTLGLMISGRIVGPGAFSAQGLSSTMNRLIKRSGEPVIRSAVRRAMNIMGRQFVLGRTIDEALDRTDKDYRYSFDMLGEAARTRADAQAYYKSYENAIAAIGKAARGDSVEERPGISVKLSALHPRFEVARRAQVLEELTPLVIALARQAKTANLSFTVDTEEADRLELSLEVIERVSGDPSLSGWNGFGLAIQAYQKRATAIIDMLADMATAHGRRMMVRLVKGAYWDTEIKRSQEQGLEGYPVFTRKTATDTSYIACAKRLLAKPDCFYPMFATHNAHTVAAVAEIAGNKPFEFQRLHGMGEALYERVISPSGTIHTPTRIYAPVGGHKELLSYLVRRLLENGANSSFVNRLTDDATPVADIVADPVEKLADTDPKPHPAIPLPRDLYGPTRRNSRGIDLSDTVALDALAAAFAGLADMSYRAAPLVHGHTTADEGAAYKGGRGSGDRAVLSPADNRVEVGRVVDADTATADAALAAADAAYPRWDATPAIERAARLEAVADAFEAQCAALMAVCTREAGKTMADGVAEVREAVDFLRYYARQARDEFATPTVLPGPTGEHNELQLHGRGVFVCISPWNFPLAIFTGQIAAALAAGNTVIAKPAEQTVLVAHAATTIFHQCGIPTDVLQLVPGPGAAIGGRLVADNRVAGVAFTGSLDTAKAINRTLANRSGPIVPLIAETGGLNAMIVDSTALPEQTIRDVLLSAFGSAGQRCSALRILYLQEDIADTFLTMLKGAMADLRVGDPSLLATDVGPVIDVDALTMLNQHVRRMKRDATLIHKIDPEPGTTDGTFFGPHVYEVEGIGALDREIFGPILHVARFRAQDLDRVVDDITRAGYGLTMGIQTRIEEKGRQIQARSRIGNTYVNRNTIGAVVGVQPFGGEGLSGTGPKAGGPHYLHRFATERVLTIDVTAAGGNASLLSLGD
ncbi:bifunctional proline dehydrogenase/L-glutamate gamma-semialdehyde dehydrogenase PutA [Fodinicurvata sp. EGI_FJ10296]|uniref:bifunctional proline dehydrogenase/L-glutamate gamma-semialdehyde dehydrogenase PutA n=1 Tax=Fodinicurvata sp. EGI_FJ10296 TaxID=3231908 RepID=UPI003451DD5B